MKKIILFLLMLICLLLYGCKTTNIENNELKATRIEAISDYGTKKVKPSEFDISKITIMVHLANGEIDAISATMDMISEDEIEIDEELNQKVLKVTKYGICEYHLNYLGLTTTFTVNLEGPAIYYNINFYVDDEIVYNYAVKENTYIDFTIPLVPQKDDYIARWDKEDFSEMITSDIDVHAIYLLDEETLIMEHMEEIYADVISDFKDKEIDCDLLFVSEVQNVNIKWQSQFKNIISDSGKYTRPKEKTIVRIDVTLSCSNYTLNKQFSVVAKGYKSLSNAIASTYVYRNYNKLTDVFFDTMDIIYCAFVEISVTGHINFSSSALGNVKVNVMQQAHEQGIYVIASLGGGGSAAANAFSEIAKDSNKRKILVEDTITLINQYGFDGVDIDWETPTSSEKANFTLLTKDLSTAIKANNPNHMLTAAIGGGMWQPPRYDLPNSIKYLDYVNVMTYSMVSNGGYYQNALYSSTAYNDTTNKVGRTMNSCSIAETVKIYEDLKVARGKLIFGLAFYGCKQVKDDSGSWTGSGSVFYTNIKKNYMNNSDYKYVYDKKAGVPYIISNDGKTFISFDDATSIKEKAKYVIDNHLGGLMNWENGCDTTGDLVEAMRIGLNKG